MLTDTISPVVADIELENFRVSDEDLPEFCDLKFENINELHIDHPGANDAGYRERRDYIASCASTPRHFTYGLRRISASEPTKYLSCRK